ncbi:MAG: DUF11 domain-containing protein, partial [Thermoanaerobaculales bacterium]|nr:DUF11 domain-containing protein [Thermoanaerobaculales bacterium]
NNGTCDLTGVVITEDIPTVTTVDGDEVPAFTVVTMDPSPTDQTGEMLVWAIGDLLAGESSAMTITVVFDEPAADGTIVVNTVCVVAEEIEDEICASATVEIGDFAGRHIGGPGFWCNQIRFAIEGRHNARFTLEELEAWLVEINETSLMFPELWDTESLESVQDLLCRPSQAETVADRLSRHLLTLWFNIVSERIDPELTFDGLCAGTAPLPGDADSEMTIAELVAAAEADILAGAEDEILNFWAEVIDFVNNATIGACGPFEPLRSRNRRAAS